MEYLVIAILIAAVGSVRLWLMQRRARSNLATLEGYKTSLERITSQAVPHPGAGRHVQAGVVRTTGHPTPLDPARRAAAKQRLEARRRSMQSR